MCALHAVWADDAGDVRLTGHLGEHRFHARAHGRFGHAPVPDAEDDLIGVAGLRGEVAHQEVGGALRFGAGQGEVVGVPGSQRAGEPERGDQQQDPPDDHPPGVSGRAPCDTGDDAQLAICSVGTHVASPRRGRLD